MTVDHHGGADNKFHHKQVHDLLEEIERSSMHVTFYLDEEEKMQSTDALPRVGEYIQWSESSGFWSVTAVVHAFKNPGDLRIPHYYVYLKHERKVQHR